MKRRRFLYCMGCAGITAITGCAVGRFLGKKGDKMSAQEGSIRPEDLTYCGLDCNSCDVYKATVHGDQEARMRAVESWTPVAQEHWGIDTLDPSIIDCTGCRTGKASFKGYGWCPTRACAQERNLSSCGLCNEWQTCDHLSESVGESSEARANLEMISQSVSKSIDGDNQ